MDKKDFKAGLKAQNADGANDTDDEAFCVEYLESLAEGDLRPIIFENYAKETGE